ncbi:MAG: dihydropteroate synthase [Kineosporiaceae bacterium]
MRPHLGEDARRRIGGVVFDFESTTAVMAIVNRTPDSFYDSGSTFSLEAALDRSREVVSQGADWVDVGGVPFSPLAGRVSPEEECRRIVPLVEAVRDMGDVVVSVDTYRSSVAAAALSAGAAVINDTSGLGDPRMAQVIAEAGGGVVITHSKAPPGEILDAPAYADVCGEVLAFLAERAAVAVASGVSPDRIFVDPGHDLNKNTLHSLEVTRNISQFAALGFPLLVSVSNKDFIGEAVGAPKEARGPATTAVLTYCVLQGARVLRVHDVPAAVSAVRMTEVLLGTRPPVARRHNVVPLMS